MEKSSSQEHGTSASVATLLPFSYEARLPPNHIRLLAIGAGSGATPIQCTLSAYKLSDIEGRYTALSYAWGLRPPEREIICNGQKLYITESLHAALWQCRENNDDELLWADAICINQTDVDEKTEQVRIMRSIYLKAFQVILWLGPSRNRDSEVADLLRQIASADITDDPTAGSLDCSRWGIPPLNEPVWAAMVSLLKRPWFERAWVIQEMAVNPRTFFRTGSIDIDVQVLLKASRVTLFINVLSVGRPLYPDYSKTQISETETSRAPVMAFFRDTFQRRGRTRLFDLLLLSRGFHTSEPKDKIFALAGLAEDYDPEFVDYRKSHSQIIIEVARKTMLLADQDFEPDHSVADLLSHVFQSSATEALPSWVADFSELNQGHIPLSGLGIFPESRHLGSGSWEFVESERDTLTCSRLGLRTPAKRVDVVVSTVEPFQAALRKLVTYYSKGDIAISIGGWLYEIWTLVDRHCSAYAESEIQEIIWTTVVCDCIVLGKRGIGEYGASIVALQRFVETATRWSSGNIFLYEKNFLTIYFVVLAAASLIVLSRWNIWPPTAFYGWYGLTSIPAAVVVSSWAFRKILDRTPVVFDGIALRLQILIHEAEMAPFSSAMGRYQTTRKFFVSESGRMGMLPLSAEAGDLVFVFPGSPIPFVLRPCSGGYRLLGDCYLHGMMDGEGHGNFDSFEVIDIV